MTWGSSWAQWDKYRSAVRRDVHQLLAWGYADAQAQLKGSHDEPGITGLIAEAMKTRLNTVAPRRFDRYSISDDSPQAGEGRVGTSRRRVDIVVECRMSRPRLLYIMEAKRLRRGSHALSKYLGVEGLERFIRASYAPHATEAAMVGYVQSPTVADWGAELEQALSDPDHVSLSVESGPALDVVVPALPHTWVTEHKRIAGPNIVIYHVLLDCC